MTGRGRTGRSARPASLLVLLLLAPLAACSTSSGTAASAALDAARAPGSPPATVHPAPPAFDKAARSTTDPASPWVVVNKQHPLPRDYAPAHLVAVDGRQVSAEVAGDLAAMRDAARAEGVVLQLASAYRPYTYQVGVHARLVRRDGAAGADRVSARPGYSEHQTGFAVDFGSATAPGCTLRNCFATTAEGRWLEAHAGEHGFLHRYTEAGTAVTGYNQESWHFRWVGRDLTAAMAAEGVGTLEEFFGVSGGPVYAPAP